MGSFLVRLFGHKVTHKVVQRHVRRGGMFDAKYGFALFKDRSVPITAKATALAIGVALTALLMAVEAPLELLLGIFLPFIGEAADMLVDGAEFVIFPILIACMVLPRLVAQQRVAQPQVIQQVANRGEVIDMPPPMLDVIGKQ